ncbi:hypothetical protein EMCRGX_G017205 [Ephydatia muelleri]
MHGGSEQLHEVQDTTSTDLISLEPHTEYTIRVRAKTVHLGDYCTPITIHTLETEIPSPPIGLKVDSVNSTSISISWQPPYDAKCIIREYQVSYTIHSGSEQLCEVQDTTSTDLISLEPHTEYTIRVRAKSVHLGDYCTPITIHTQETDNVSAILNNSKHITFKQLRIIKLIFYGTPRAGKTTLRKQLVRVVEGVGLQPSGSNIEPSTNIAEVCGPIFVQRIAMTNEGSNEWKWTCQKLDDIAKSLMQCLGNTKLHSDTESNDLPEQSLDEHMIKNDGQQNLSLESQHSVGSRDLGADRPPMQVLTEETRKQFHPSETIEKNDTQKLFATDIDITELFRNAIKTGKWEEVVGALSIDKATFLQIIDGGGQPSFQEIFPLLISGPSLTVLVFKLTDDLEALHPVQYQPESQREGQMVWQDTYVVKDIISHALASFAVSQKKDILLPFPCKILLIGTHKDKLEVSQDPQSDKERNKKAQIESIAMKLYGWLHPSKAFESIQVQSMDDLITGIDNFSQHDVVLVKKKIEELILQIESQDVPAPWLVFDFVLHKLAEMKKLCKLGKSDCTDIAHVCGVTENINGVLHYLHYEAGTLLYYSDIPGLNEYVITDFQLIFDSISKIIIQYFENSISGPHLKHKKLFTQKGQFDASVLRDCKGVNTILLCDDNHTEVFKMTKKAHSKWKGIGRELGFTDNELSSIVREPGQTGEEDYYSAMLMRWLHWAPPNHSLPSVQQLSSVLREVGFERLAFDLDEEYSQPIESLTS